MNTIPANDSVGAYDWHVLTLTSPDDLILGIWGPYATATQAGHALEELKGWPLDGEWAVVKLKKFIAPAPKPPTDSVFGPAWRTTTNT